MAQYPSFSNTYSSIGEASTGLVKLGQASALVITALNVSPNDCFLMFFDRSTLPTTGSKPKLVLPVYKTNGYSELTETILGSGGLVFNLGLTWGVSTNALTLQPALATDCVLTIGWV